MSKAFQCGLQFCVTAQVGDVFNVELYLTDENGTPMAEFGKWLMRVGASVTFAPIFGVLRLGEVDTSNVDLFLNPDTLEIQIVEGVG